MGANKELVVAVAPSDGRVKPRGDREAQVSACVTQALFHQQIHGCVLDDAALAHLPRLQFKLRLDQGQQGAARLEQGHNSGQDQRLGDEGQVRHHQVKRRHKALGMRGDGIGRIFIAPARCLVIQSVIVVKHAIRAHTVLVGGDQVVGYQGTRIDFFHT